MSPRCRFHWKTHCTQTTGCHSEVHTNPRSHIVLGVLCYQLQVTISWSPHPSETLPLKPKLRWLFMAPVPWEIKIAEHPRGEKVNGDMLWEQILASPEQESTTDTSETPSHKGNLILRLARAEPHCFSSPTSFCNTL